MTDTGMEKCIRILTEISSKATAPFYEARVASYIMSELHRMGIPAHHDLYGNIVAEYEGPGACATGGMALVAHMDHPGFELLTEDGSKARLLGGVRSECFGNHVPVRVFPAQPPTHGIPDDGIPGVVTGYEAGGNETILSIELHAIPPALPAFGVWDVPRIEIRDSICHLRAADDLVGCASILMVLDEAVEKQLPCRICGVFTRAEEVGFVGSIHLAGEGLIGPDTVVVSLETSKELPGAEVGQGPVIRVGDRTNTFDGRAEAILRAGKDRLVARSPGTKVQRQLMSGGTCEGSVFMQAGYSTTAMALPLGNYHNVSLNLTIEPEYIHLGDMETQIDLLVSAAECIQEGKPSLLPQSTLDAAIRQSDRLRSTFESWEPQVQN